MFREGDRLGVLLVNARIEIPRMMPLSIWRLISDTKSHPQHTNSLIVFWIAQRIGSYTGRSLCSRKGRYYAITTRNFSHVASGHLMRISDGALTPFRSKAKIEHISSWKYNRPNCKRVLLMQGRDRAVILDDIMRRELTHRIYRRLRIPTVMWRVQRETSLVYPQPRLRLLTLSKIHRTLGLDGEIPRGLNLFSGTSDKSISLGERLRHLIHLFPGTAVQNRHKSNGPRCKRELCGPGTGILKSRSAPVS
jgi:hypothetical protein